MANNQQKSDRHKPSRMVRIPESMALELEALGEEKETNLTDEVKTAVREYLERNGRWPAKSKAQDKTPAKKPKTE